MEVTNVKCSRVKMRSLATIKSMHLIPFDVKSYSRETSESVQSRAKASQFVESFSRIFG